MKSIFRKFLAYLIIINYLSLSIAPALAFSTKRKIIPKPTETSLVIDAETGKILQQRNSKVKIYPASLTKIMTLYLIFEALNSKKLKLDQKLFVSTYATKALPSRLGLKMGDKLTVEEAILGLIVKSANDVARAVAQNIAGSEAKFARLMTIRARQLGMRSTLFKNASGWHDPNHVSTAHDLAKLTMAIKRDFPQYYHFFKTKSFKFNNNIIKSRNRVSCTYPGAEGMKTGFHTPSGFNLIIAAKRNGRRLIAVVTGRKSSNERDKIMIDLLDKHFGVKSKTIKRPSRKIVRNK